MVSTVGIDDKFRKNPPASGTGSGASTAGTLGVTGLGHGVPVGSKTLKSSSAQDDVQYGRDAAADHNSQPVTAGSAVPSPSAAMWKRNTACTDTRRGTSMAGKRPLQSFDASHVSELSVETRQQPSDLARSAAAATRSERHGPQLRTGLPGDCEFQ